MSNYTTSAKKFGAGLLGMVLTVVLASMCNSCCYSQLVKQLPDQVYYADDSCSYFLPDYTQIITPIDNCKISYFYQYPTAGNKLELGEVTEVSIVAGDVTGNERTIKFKVMLVDTIPPDFYVDTLLFNSLGHFQNDIHTFRLNQWILANGDTLTSPDGFGFWGYYTDVDVAYLELAKGTFNEITYVPWYDVPEDHPLYFEGWPKIQETWNGIDSLTFPTFNNERYFKRSIFFAENDYKLAAIKVYLSKTGNPSGDVYLNLFEVDENDNPIGSSKSLGLYPVSKITNEYQWHTITMQPTMIEAGKKYAINMGVPQTTSNDKVIWVCNATRNSPIRWLRYTYDSGATWGKNPAMCYMFEVWGNIAEVNE